MGRPPRGLGTGEEGAVVICTDCRRRYERTAGHRSMRWCSECLLEHVGLCRSCRHLFDREHSTQVMCSSCSPTSGRPIRWLWISVLGAAVCAQAGLLLAVVIRDRWLRRTVQR